MSTAIRSHRKDKLLANRPLDFIYDPVFTVSNAKDYYMTVSESMKQATKFVLQPNFSSMFSDIQHYPNSSLVLKSAYPIPYFIDASFKGKSRSMARTKQSERIEVDGADRFRYFRKPCDIGKEIVPKKPSLQYKLLLTDFVDPSAGLFEKKHADADLSSSTPASPRPASSQNVVRGIQTDYREAEAQTIPWTPPYVFHGTVTPEILTLANLSWGQGLPAGTHEVELIERARIKREWEQVLMNSFKNPQDVENRQKCIIDMELNEWLFREQEIDKINSHRMEMTNTFMKGQKKNQFNRLDERVNRQIRRKELQKNEQLKTLQQKKEREMRKLMAKHQMWENKMRTGSKEIVDNRFAVKHTTVDKIPFITSTDHEVIKYDKMMFGTVEGLILMENAPSDPAPAFNFAKASKPKPHGVMCHKLCRWSTDEDLKQLQKDLQKTNVVDIGQKTHTLTKKEKVKPLLPPILCIEIPVKHNVELCKATAFLQQLLRGRAVQYKVFQDRKRLQPLIEELKKTRALYKEENDAIAEKRYERLALMRKQFIYNKLAGKRDQVVNDFNGEVTAALLDFLAKELQRLEAEKQVQAFAILAERERWQREAVESGRRQKEEFNRQQHDDMFKQVMNIRNESVDVFLEDMLAKSINWLADDEARDYVRNVAHKVDMAAQQAHTRKDAIEQEEMVTDLIYNYIMPDVKKALIRHKLHESQKKYLEIADNIIQNELSCKHDSATCRMKLEISAHDENDDPHESENLIRTDAESNVNEAISEPSYLNVFQTHCLHRTKSEEAYYELKAQNEMFNLQRAKLYQLAEFVKEEFLDVLISKAEEMAYKVAHEKEHDFVFPLGSSDFESEKRLKMAKLMVLSEILNDDFLSKLIALAEEGKHEREQSDEKGVEGVRELEDGVEEEREFEEGVEKEREFEDGVEEKIEFEDGVEEERELEGRYEDGCDKETSNAEERESVTNSIDFTMNM